MLWRSEQLAEVEADLASFNGEVATLEREYESLDGRGDYRADVQREQLSPKLSAALSDQRAFQRVVDALREQEVIVNFLLPIYREKKAEVQSMVAAITARVEVPDRETMLQLWAANRELERLRLPLYEVTHLPELTKPFDGLDAVKEFWHQQAIDRARIWSHAMSIHHLPTPPTPSWAAEAAHLRELHRALSQEIPA
jgi:hypothetical protein